MSTHDEIRTLADQVLRDVEQARIDSDARLKALNEQCDKLLAVIDAVQAGVKSLDAKCDPPKLLKIDDRGIVVGMDGWVAHYGGGQPVSNDTAVRVRLRGQVRDVSLGPILAEDIWWPHRLCDIDIVAYKVEG